MINLSHRSSNKELLDNDEIPFADIRQNMKELNTINKYLGGHKITIAGLKELLRVSPAKKKIIICEIGCGGGDNLKAINDFCNKKNIPVKYIGIDIKTECIDFAKEQYPQLDAEWIVDDYKNINFDAAKPDIIFSSLFCHHFTKTELTAMLQWMRFNTTTGFFINDLHRHPMAYYSIKWITAVFSKSYLVKHDAAVSVTRGFKKQDLIQILNDGGISGYSIRWKWAFRYLIICKND